MRGNLVSAGIVSFLVTSCLLWSVVLDSDSARGRTTLYVGGSGMNNYTSIQEAINAAVSGDTIYVYDDNAPYHEHLYVDRPLNLTGESKYTTTVDGSGFGQVVVVGASWVNVTGFTITNGGTGGIYLGSSNDTVAGNIVFGNAGNGISLPPETSNNTITGNIISLNGENGIDLVCSSYDTIEGNDIHSNTNHGINFNTGFYNVVNENSIRSNQWGGVWLADSLYNIIADNDIFSNYRNGLSLDVSRGNRVANNTVSLNNRNGTWLMESMNNVIEHNAISSNGENGIWLVYSDNNTIANNFITSNNENGIQHLSQDSLIANNFISSNGEDGISLDWGGRHTIVGNLISLNTIYGIESTWSDHNSIYHNWFIDNHAGLVQASDETGESHWSDTYPSGGNYWSDFDEPSEGAYDDYQGQDQDSVGSDGIVDNGTIAGGGRNPYIIDGGADAKDHYPLMQQPIPDLEVKNSDVVFVPSSPVRNGTSLLINATIHNVGFGDAFDVVVRFYDDNPLVGKRVGNDQTIASIAAGSYDYAEVAWTATPVGTRNIHVVVDPDDVIIEDDESNNIANRAIEVTLPDYTFWNPPIAQQEVSTESSVPISSQVRNVGDVDATAESAIAFYDQTTPLSPFSNYAVPSLNASEISIQYNATWVAPTDEGTYYVIIKVDYHDDIEELDEDNNAYVIEFVVSKNREKPNYKPLIALILTLVLLVLGMRVSYRYPIRFRGILRKDRLHTFLVCALPFVIAEAITGLISLLTGQLSVPPVIGVGMIVDLIILLTGLTSYALVYRLGTDSRRTP